MIAADRPPPMIPPPKSFHPPPKISADQPPLIIARVAPPKSRAADHPPPPKVVPPPPKVTLSSPATQDAFAVPSRGSSAPNAESVVASMSWDTELMREAERRVSFANGTKFRDRGPLPPFQGGPRTWNGQDFRYFGAEKQEETGLLGRWGNRGQNSGGYAAWKARKASKGSNGRAYH